MHKEVMLLSDENGTNQNGLFLILLFSYRLLQHSNNLFTAFQGSRKASHLPAGIMSVAVNAADLQIFPGSSFMQEKDSSSM